MALNWCYQEPWPSAANNSLINWPNEIKPAYYHVKNACRPILASVRVKKFEWREGEDFTCDIFILNDTYDKLPPAKVKVFIQYDNMEKEFISWDCPGSDPFKNAQGPTANIKIPPMTSPFFSIQIRVEGKPEYNSTYTLYNGKLKVERSLM